MNFCTSPAWKWPGSSVMKRKRGCAAADAGMTPATAAQESATAVRRRKDMATSVRLLRVAELRGEAHRAVALALGARQHRVRLGVVHEPLRLRVPRERAVQLHADPAHDARRV